MIILGPVAIAHNGVIGSNNDLPWYLPEDLKHFKELTTGHTVVMGRKTFESIMKRLGKPLPNRTNVVITSQTNYQAPPGVLVYNDLDIALDDLKDQEKVFLIGGYNIFKAGIEKAQTMFVTHINKDYEGDISFPEIDWNRWQKTAEESHPEFTFAQYEKSDERG